MGFEYICDGSADLQKHYLEVENMSNEQKQALISTGEVEKLMLNIRGKDVLIDSMREKTTGGKFPPVQ